MLTEEFIISKMLDNFEPQEEAYDYKEYDYKILGDTEAFMVYFYIDTKIVWVHFLWASKKKRMILLLREFFKLVPLTSHEVLFDSDDFAKMFGNHARQIYIWEKEIK